MLLAKPRLCGWNKAANGNCASHLDSLSPMVHIQKEPEDKLTTNGQCHLVARQVDEPVSAYVWHSHSGAGRYWIR
jgi:hypothetical protein